MELLDLILHIEALIFASDKPLTAVEITELMNTAFPDQDKMGVEQVNMALEGIVEKYSSGFYPFEVRESGGGWQFLTKKVYHKTIAQLNGEKFLKRLSAATLETLAIIAYKQPITKGEIETIRGVSSDYTVQKLLEKELIVITGRNEELPGHPLVYATSKSFMDYFGINSPEDLPQIKDVLSHPLINPTIVHHTEFEQSNSLSVSDEGELIDAETPDIKEEALDLAENKGAVVKEENETSVEGGLAENKGAVPANDDSEAEEDTTDENEGGLSLDKGEEDESADENTNSALDNTPED
jgi:segregation and condensation protein B